MHNYLGATNGSASGELEACLDEAWAQALGKTLAELSQYWARCADNRGCAASRSPGKLDATLGANLAVVRFFDFYAETTEFRELWLQPRNVSSRCRASASPSKARARSTERARALAAISVCNCMACLMLSADN